MNAAWIAADWPAPPAVHAGTTRRDAPIGVSAPPFDRLNLGERCGDDPAAVATNRAALRQALALPAEPCWLRQQHGTGVVRIDETTAVDPPAADAAITDRPGRVLAILSADCLPVLLCADDGRELAAAHAGWRGLAAGVLEATVAAMRTPPERLLAWIGPHAGPFAYEVGVEVRRAFVEADPDAAIAFVATRPGHWWVDLNALARRRLAAAGVTRVHGGGLCTISDAGRFYSHRRDASTGRMASLIWCEPVA